MKNFDLNTMFNYIEGSTINIDNFNIENGHFLNGAINYAEPHRLGSIDIRNSRFKNIKSENGPIIRIDEMADKYESTIKFDNVAIQETEAQDRGGVVFSTNKYTNQILSFNNCKFIDTKANSGSICYALDTKSEPYFSNKNEIFNYHTFSTNPIKLEFDTESEREFTILSGDTIHDNIKFILVDDY
ncbi:hypothetical protein BCR36DRAFT_362294, partial [Piromyces finnis]